MQSQSNLVFLTSLIMAYLWHLYKNHTFPLPGQLEPQILKQRNVSFSMSPAINIMRKGQFYFIGLWVLVIEPIWLE